MKTTKKKAQTGSKIAPADSDGVFKIQEYYNSKALKGGLSQMAQDSLSAGAWKKEGSYIGNAPKSGVTKKYVETPRAIENANTRVREAGPYSRKTGGKVTKAKTGTKVTKKK